MERSPEQIARTRALWLATRPAAGDTPTYLLDAPHWWQAAAALAVALVLQTSLAPLLTLRGGVVSFVLLVVAWYGVRTGTLRGMTAGLIAGACEDALSGTSGAAWTFADAVSGAAAGRAARTWLADSRPFAVSAAGALTLVRFAAYTIVLQGEGRAPAAPTIGLHGALWQAALTAAAAAAALAVRPGLIAHAQR